MGTLKEVLALTVRNRQWRKQNPHNDTHMENLFNRSMVSVGKGTYGGIFAITTGDDSRLIIGNYCSIASGVRFMVQGEHALDTISTYPFRVQVGHSNCGEALSKGNIVVEDDVWIGESALILSGVTIGQGAVVAAGAVVSKDVPPYAIVGGIPAKVIKYRFTENIREKLITVDFSKLNDEIILSHMEDLYTPVTENSDLSWLPREVPSDE